MGMQLEWKGHKIGYTEVGREPLVWLYWESKHKLQKLVLNTRLNWNFNKKKKISLLRLKSDLDFLREFAWDVVEMIPGERCVRDDFCWEIKNFLATKNCFYS